MKKFASVILSLFVLLTACSCVVYASADARKILRVSAGLE